MASEHIAPVKQDLSSARGDFISIFWGMCFSLHTGNAWLFGESCPSGLLTIIFFLSEIWRPASCKEVSESARDHRASE